MVESLEDLRRQLKRETTFEDNKKEMEALGRERSHLKSQIRAKKFARERPKTAGFFRGLVSAGATAGRGIQKAAGEVQRQEAVKQRARAKSQSKGRVKGAVYNLYGERIR